MLALSSLAALAAALALESGLWHTIRVGIPHAQATGSSQRMRRSTYLSSLQAVVQVSARHADVQLLATMPSDPDADELEGKLLAPLLDSAGLSGRRGGKLDTGDRGTIGAWASKLEAKGRETDVDTSLSPLLSGRWRVLFQGNPESGAVSPFNPLAWQKYITGDGPSPIQNLVSDSTAVGRLYQILELSPDTSDDGLQPSSGRFINVVDFTQAPLPGLLAIEASLEGRPERNRLAFRFRSGRVLLSTIWNGTLDLPYPVPFDLLGDNALGWLQTDYLSPTLRLSRGNKGSLFVLVPEPLPDSEPLQALLSPPSPPPPPPPPSELSRDPVIVCPAQFGTAIDYDDLTSALVARGHPTYVTPLKRLDWLRLIPSALTPEYWRAQLRPEAALPFYFEALDRIIDEVADAHPGTKIQLVAHSIGGWIARAYLGQADAGRRELCSALVTLGTPHASPPEGLLTQVDQTRGLLTYVNTNYPGAFHENIRYLAVGSEAVKGTLDLGRLDSLLAYASYLPLSGNGTAVGDGICPLEAALLEGAEHRVVHAFHIDFVPFLGTRLIGTPWYGSAECFEQWADFLE